MTEEYQRHPSDVCDCLNFCGDDEDVRHGRIPPCQWWIGVLQEEAKIEDCIRQVLNYPTGYLHVLRRTILSTDDVVVGRASHEAARVIELAQDLLKGRV